MIKTNKFIHWGLVLAWMIVIFCFSSQTGKESGALSNEVATKIVAGSVKVKKVAVIKRTNTVVQSAKVSKSNERIKKRKKVVAKRKFYRQTRDFAHCVLYFVLAALFFFALKQHGICSWKVFLWTLLFCVLYSLIDEFHQSFVPGRGPEFNDALRDLIGSTFGATFAWLTSLVSAQYLHFLRRG
jgi:VanZ family protein